MALRWEPGARDEVSWWDGGSFQQNLRDSDRLEPRRRNSIDISMAPARVREMREVMHPHYEHLRRFRLEPRAAGAIADT